MDSLPKDFKAFIEQYKDRIHGKISEYVPRDIPQEFSKMIRSYIDRKGQYRRPSHVLLWTLLYGGRIEDALLPAAAQQASEDYFLMHDDWMDDNELRRGGPSAHKIFGPVYAILAGDTVHAMLWKMASDAQNMLKGERGKKYMDKFYDMMLTTHVGQYHDIALTNEKDITKFSMEDYYRSIHGKTAYYTVYGPMQCGAIIANAPDSEIEKISGYGTPIGLAFQIKDDILDCISTEKELGKSIGTDVKDGVKTIILWHTVQNANTSTLDRIKTIYAKDRREKTDKEVKFVLDTFKEVGSIQFAEQEATKLLKEATAKFESATKSMQESPVKDLARNALGQNVMRSK